MLSWVASCYTIAIEPYLFVQNSQHLFVQNSQLYKFVCLLVYLFPQPQNPIFTSQSFASVFWKMKNCCFVVKKNLKLETWSFLGTCWLFGSWMLTSFSFTLPLPSNADKKVKVPMSGWRLCQMTLKSHDTLLDTNWYFDLDEKWISIANNSYYFLLVIIPPPSFAKHL